ATTREATCPLPGPSRRSTLVPGPDRPAGRPSYTPAIARRATRPPARADTQESPRPRPDRPPKSGCFAWGDLAGAAVAWTMILRGPLPLSIRGPRSSRYPSAPQSRPPSEAVGLEDDELQENWGNFADGFDRAVARCRLPLHSGPGSCETGGQAKEVLPLRR